MGTTYDGLFFDYIERGALASARHVVGALASLKIGSVLDVGCGRGAWLSEWASRGVTAVVGADGDYVDRKSLLINAENFHGLDITQRFDLKSRFDLVECLEVGEHISTECSPALVDNLTRHAPIVMFSAALPGQGGLQHINEQPLSFWRKLFAERGYVPFDCVRPAVAGLRDVEPWYRYNIVLYVHADHTTDLPPAIAAHRVQDDQELTDYSSPAWRVRRMILRQLPVPVVSLLAAIKHRAVLLSEGRPKLSSPVTT